MPLSENEKRVLEEMEAALSADDPKFAHRLRGELSSQRVRRYVLGFIFILAGMAILIGGLVAKNVFIGISGFLVSFVSTALIIAGSKNRVIMGVEEKKAKGRMARSSLSSIMEQRWEKRRWDS
jgi:hypothetical protein